jgi:hypothetical protein
LMMLPSQLRQWSSGSRREPMMWRGNYQDGNFEWEPEHLIFLYSPDISLVGPNTPLSPLFPSTSTCVVRLCLENKFLILGFEVFTAVLWRVSSSGIWRRIIRRVSTDVSEEHIASIFKVE